MGSTIPAFAVKGVVNFIFPFRMHYISPSPGGGGPSNINQAASVYAFIGTPPQWRRHSRLCWKQG